MAKKVTAEAKVEKRVIGGYEFSIGDEVVSGASGRSGRISKFLKGDCGEVKTESGSILTVNLTNFLPYEVYLEKSKERFKITG